MERRLFLTIVLCLGVMILWSTFVVPRMTPPPEPKPLREKTPPAAKEPVKKVEPATQDPEMTPETIPEFSHADQKLRVTRLANSVIDVTFTNRGATLSVLRLKDFPESPESEDPIKLLPNWNPERGHFSLEGVEEGPEMRTRNWKVVEKDRMSVKYSFQRSDGVEVQKKFELVPEKYLVRFTLTLQNRGKGTKKVKLRLTPVDGLSHDGEYRSEMYAQGFVGLEKQKMQEYPLATSLSENGISYTASGYDWFGAKNRYFAATFIPEEKGESHKILSKFRLTALTEDMLKAAGGLPGVVCEVEIGDLEIAQSPQVFVYTLYAGPIRQETLSQAPRGIGRILDYTGYDPIAGVILGLLKFFNSIFSNYGVAILLTTLLIRLCLFPLSKKAQVSAFRMQELQPKIKILQQRYKQDPQKLNKETWKMFRESGANPMSGCLPMLLQMPVFFGMYAVLDLSIDLRQSPFVFWIQDLSQPDRLFGPWDKPFLILWEINVLPLIMCVTWFLQFKYMPKSPDPQARTQQKVFMFMPVFFLFICYGLAAGLSFYFFVNSLLAMIEQKIIKKFFLKRVDETSS